MIEHFDGMTAKHIMARIMKIARFHTFITVLKSNAITDVC